MDGKKNLLMELKKKPISSLSPGEVSVDIVT